MDLTVVSCSADPKAAAQQNPFGPPAAIRNSHPGQVPDEENLLHLANDASVAVTQMDGMAPPFNGRGFRLTQSQVWFPFYLTNQDLNRKKAMVARCTSICVGKHGVEFTFWLSSSLRTSGHTRKTAHLFAKRDKALSSSLLRSVV